MVWVVGAVIAGLTFLNTVEGDTLGHWWSFNKAWAFVGIAGVIGLLAAVSALGIVTYLQLDIAEAATPAEKVIGAAAAAVLAQSSLRRASKSDRQKQLEVDGATVTVPSSASAGDPVTMLALGSVPVLMRWVDVLVQGSIRRWARRMTPVELVNAVIYVHYEGKRIFSSQDRLNDWCRRQLNDMQGVDKIDAMSARTETEGLVVFAYNAYRLTK